MKEKVNLDDEDGITVLKDKGYNLKIEVDTEKRSVADALKLLNPDFNSLALDKHGSLILQMLKDLAHDKYDYIDYYNNKRLQRNLGVITPMERYSLSLAAQQTL